MCFEWKQQKLDEHNLIELEDYSGNGMYDIKDFVEVPNEKILKYNKGIYHMSNYDTMFELLFEQIKNLSEEIEELREEVKKLKNTK